MTTAEVPGRRRPLHALDYHVVGYLRAAGRAWAAVLGLLTAVALALGCLGYHQYWMSKTGVARPANTVYMALQLFALEMPETAAEYPISLELARYLAAFVSFSAVFGLLGKVFDGRIEATRLWALGRGHVILCGLGDKGAELVRRLRDERRFVVVIEPFAGHDDIDRCRALGAIVLIGSPTDRWHLEKARLRHADVLLAIAPDGDRANVETAILAYEMSQEPRRGVLTCALQVSDPDLAAIARRHPMATKETDHFDLQAFAVEDACARAMLREAFLARGGEPAGSILVVGVSPPSRLGERLILRAAKEWSIDRPRGDAPLLVDAVGPDATGAAARIRARCPSLGRACTIRPRVVSAESPDCGGWFDPESPPGVAFVCLEDEALALVVADRLRAALPADVPVIVRTIDRDSGLGSLIRERRPENLIAVGVTDRVFGLAASLRPVRELLAEAIHHEYVRYHLAAPLDPAGKPAARLWEDLDPQYRESSRAQADDIDRKLRQIGRRRVHSPDDLDELCPLTDREVEALARDEHDRWCAERRSRGWTYGDPRDNERKRHPNLVPWDDPRLTDPIKDIDRNAIRRLPAVLARADYRIVGDPPAAAP